MDTNVQAFATTEDQRKLLAKDYANKIEQMLRSKGFRKIEVTAVIDETGLLSIELKKGGETAKLWFDGFTSGIQSQIVTQLNVIMRQSAQIEALEKRLEELEGDRQTQEEVKTTNRLEVNLGELFPGLVGTKQQQANSELTGRKH